MELEIGKYYIDKEDGEIIKVLSRRDQIGNYNCQLIRPSYQGEYPFYDEPPNEVVRGDECLWEPAEYANTRLWKLLNA